MEHDFNKNPLTTISKEIVKLDKKHKLLKETENGNNTRKLSPTLVIKDEESDNWSHLVEVNEMHETLPQAAEMENRLACSSIIKMEPDWDQVSEIKLIQGNTFMYGQAKPEPIERIFNFPEESDMALDGSKVFSTKQIEMLVKTDNCENLNEIKNWPKSAMDEEEIKPEIVDLKDLAQIISMSPGSINQETHETHLPHENKEGGYLFKCQQLDGVQRKGRHVCTYSGCINRSYTSAVMFYSFPKETERAKTWLMACNRQDLLNKVETLHKNYRVCSAHFNPNMFLKGKRKLLRKDAVPKVFLQESDLPSVVPNVSSVFTQTSPPTSSTSYVQTPGFLISKTPRIKKLREMTSKLKNENNQLKKNNEQLVINCRDLEERLQKTLDKISLEQYQQLTYKFCPSKDIADFINIQITQISKLPKGRRYSDEFKYKCLSMYLGRPNFYKTLLTKKFCLPGAQTLRQLLVSHIDTLPGLENPNIFKAIKMKVEKFNELNRLCVLCVDEIGIKANMSYNSGRDYVFGVEDHGNEDRVFKPARTSTVLMVRGIFWKWKQPLSYFFYNTSCPGKQLKEIIFSAVQKLKGVGLNVILLVCDIGSNNIQLKNILQVTPETPYFFVDTDRIFFMFDIPHLLISLRNMLMKYDFIVNDKKVSWQHIVEFYELDKDYSVSAPKLTDSHIFPSNLEKTKVKYATQVFSATVKAALSNYIRFGCISPEAAATADFIGKIDQIFDIFNSSKTSGAKKFKLAFKGLDYQTDFLNDSLHLFNNLTVVDKNGVKNVTNTMKFISGFKISINALLNLWPVLKSKNVSFLFTRRLNQDYLVNFFGSVRQQNGNCKNPTPMQFKRTFKKLFCVSIFTSCNENCETDADNVLLKLSDIIKKDDIFIPGSVPSPPDITPQFQADLPKNSSLQTHFLRYFAGYLIKQCLNIHKCAICEEYSKAHQNLDETSLFCYYKAYQNVNLDTFGNLNMPHNDFVNYISLLEIIFQRNFEHIVLKNDVITHFVNICQDSRFDHPCKNFPHQYLIRLYGRVRLLYALKFINRNLRTVKNSNMLI